MDNIRNVVIIGSGCAGHTAALYTARAKLKPLVLEGHEPGGQLSLTTLVENFPGFPEGIQGPALINPSDQFRASRTMLDRAQQNDKVHFLTDTVVEDVYDPAQQEVTALKLRNLKTDKVCDFPTSAMFLGIGHNPNARMFEGQLDLDQDGYIITKDYVFTRVPGVYAGGDIQDRRYRQAITAAGTGCMAALEAERFLEQDE